MRRGLFWIKDLTDEQAYMELVLCNTQSELHPLEEGKHAAESGKSGSEYAKQVGQSQPAVALKIMASRVWSAITCVITPQQAKDSWRNLAEIHAAPQWLWTALVQQMIESSWTVQTTRDKVGALKDIAEPPLWADLTALEEIKALAELVDASLLLECEDEYSSISPIQEPRWRVRTLLMKLDSDDKHGTDFGNKFVPNVEAIFSGIPKPKDWQTFQKHDLPLLFTNEEVQQFAMDHKLNKSQTKAINELQKANPEAFSEIVNATPEEARVTRKSGN